MEAGYGERNGKFPLIWMQVWFWYNNNNTGIILLRLLTVAKGFWFLILVDVVIMIINWRIYTAVFFFLIMAQRVSCGIRVLESWSHIFRSGQNAKLMYLRPISSQGFALVWILLLIYYFRSDFHLLLAKLIEKSQI